MPARAASRSTAPTKSRCSTSRTNVIASPLFWQPKQYQTPCSGFTENDGDFSLWNGQRPEKRRPTRFSATCSGERDEIGGFSDPLHVLVEDAHRAQARRRGTAPRHDTARQALEAPAEQLDAEAERVTIGHPG